jgi:hypothetical protein
MYIAITTKDIVLEISSNEQSSLEGMQRYSQLGISPLKRFYTTEKAFVDYSMGKTQFTELDVVDGKVITKII